MPSPQFSICAFCGSRSGRNPEYARAARQFGGEIARNGWRLVYGAGDIGIMGELSRAAKSHGGVTLGVIPAHLVEKERPSHGANEVIVTEDMHERKKVMFMNAEVIVTLPGGPGSLDEMFEVMTWKQLGLHRKPIYLLNVQGYWDPLVDLARRVVDEGFASPSFLGLMRVKSNVPDLVEALQADFSSLRDSAT